MKINRQKRNAQGEWEYFIDDMTPDEELEYKEKMIGEIKQKYSKEIFARYSQTDQSNMTARVAEINTLCLLEGRHPNNQELIDLNSAKDMINWIRQKRADCANEITNL